MSVLKSLQREYKALESELRRIQEKIEFYNEEIPRIEEKMAELAEVIEIVSQLQRYQEDPSINDIKAWLETILPKENNQNNEPLDGIIPQKGEDEQ
jgi:prefoldin subunit 5